MKEWILILFTSATSTGHGISPVSVSHVNHYFKTSESCNQFAKTVHNSQKLNGIKVRWTCSPVDQR